MREVTSVLLHFLRSQLADISQAFLNELYRVLIHLIEVGRSIVETVIPVVSEPLDIFFDSFYIFFIFFGRIGIVHTKVTEAAVLLRHTEVDLQCFCMTDMKITVRLRWETGVDFLTLIASARSDIFFDCFVYKTLIFAHVITLAFLSHAFVRNFFLFEKHLSAFHVL